MRSHAAAPRSLGALEHKHHKQPLLSDAKCDEVLPKLRAIREKIAARILTLSSLSHAALAALHELAILEERWEDEVLLLAQENVKALPKFKLTFECRLVKLQ
jgi:hypothetical protein